MEGRAAYVPGAGLVTYVPGRSSKRLVAPEDSYPPVQVPENRSSIPGVGDKTDWDGHGIFAVVAILAVGLITDGATLLLLAWVTR